jgi:hypothetical protein
LREFLRWESVFNSAVVVVHFICSVLKQISRASTVRKLTVVGWTVSSAAPYPNYDEQTWTADVSSSHLDTEQQGCP